MKLTHNLIPLIILLLSVLLSSCSEEKKRPNILFAISDDQSFPHTSFAGCSWINTPAFDRIASSGIYFKNCYAGSPGCAPSRSSIVTGRYHWQNEQAGQHASGWPKKYIPFTDLLDSSGYHTGRTGKGVGPFQYGAPFREEDAAGKAYNDIRYEAGSEDDERFAEGINTINYFANFKQFMEERKDGEPFFFWYGATEPHRSYEKDSWKRHSKSLQNVEVPEFLPDTEVVRGDLLDYAVEIEWFDLHLQRMLDYLEEIGELDNTIIIVTADNGMPFPRAKANGYEYGVHVPMAISFPRDFPGGRVVDDLISFVDLAPSILELTGTAAEDMLPISGKSRVSLLQSEEEGKVGEANDYVLAGRERHSSSRYQNLGYPQRVIRQNQYLYIWNMKPERWPAGAPQRLVPREVSEGAQDTPQALYPMYGIDEKGVHHSDWAFTDIDECPTKSVIIENYWVDSMRYYFDLALAKRPEFELYDVTKDPECLTNLATHPEFSGIASQMESLLRAELTATEDPRLTAANEGVFDTYKRYSPMRKFPKPDWAAAE